MANPAILAQLNGSLAYEDGGAGGTATGTGSVRWRSGHTGSVEAALVEIGSTNKVTDPLYQNAFTYYSRDATHSVVSHPTVTGANAFSMTFGGASPYVNVIEHYGASATANKTLSIDLWASSGTVDVDVYGSIKDPGSGWAVVSSDTESGVTLTTTPQRVTVALTHDPTMVDAFAELGVLPSDAASTATVLAAFPQLEALAFSTSAIPELDGSGDLLPGYSWAGTAHESASTRDTTSISIPLATAPGSVAARYSEDDGATWLFGYIETLGANTVGSYGSITHDGSNLVIASDRSLTIGPVFAFTDTLTAGEQATLDSEPTWTFGMALTPANVDAAMVQVSATGTAPAISATGDAVAPLAAASATGISPTISATAEALAPLAAVSGSATAPPISTVTGAEAMLAAVLATGSAPYIDAKGAAVAPLSVVSAMGSAPAIIATSDAHALLVVSSAAGVAPAIVAVVDAHALLASVAADGVAEQITALVSDPDFATVTLPQLLATAEAPAISATGDAVALLEPAAGDATTDAITVTTGAAAALEPAAATAAADAITATGGAVAEMAAVGGTGETPAITVFTGLFVTLESVTATAEAPPIATQLGALAVMETVAAVGRMGTGDGSASDARTDWTAYTTPVIAGEPHYPEVRA